MKKVTERIADLIVQQMRQGLNETEEKELNEWLSASDNNRQAYGLLNDPVWLQNEIIRFDKTRASVWKRISTEVPELELQAPVRKIQGYWWAAAAILLLLVGGVSYILFNKTKAIPAVTTAQNKNVPVPGSRKATLVLADGSETALGRSRSFQDGGAQLIDDGSFLQYRSVSGMPGTMNTVRTPNGGEYMVALPDGSKVWLNAGSSLKYPLSFDAKERKVQLSGEGYFEVAKDASRPFRVEFPAKAQSQFAEVEVLGTHFNIMAYDNEPVHAATLLEGSVKLTNGTRQVMLNPGQQATVGNDIKVMNLDDANAAIGWKNGYFIFRNAPLSAIMRQVARWYDTEVIFDDEVNEEFNFAVLRNKSLMEVLDIMQLTGRVHFTLEGKIIRVRK